MMKIKLLFITIFLGIGAYLTANSGREFNDAKLQSVKLESIVANVSTTNDNTTSVLPLSNKDFIIKDKNNYIELGGKYGDFKTNEKTTEFEPGDATYLFDYYLFKSFSIITEMGGDDNCKILQINITDSIIQTSRKIKVGDSASNVFKKYGKTKYHKLTKATGYYEYQYDGKIITFYMDKNKKVSEIELELL